MKTTTDFVLIVLELIHYFLFATYLLLLFGIKYFYDDSEAGKYTKSLDTIFKLSIGLLLISFAFPVVAIDIASPKYKEGIIKLMIPAGLVVLTSIKMEDIRQILDTLEYLLSFKAIS